MVSAVVFGLSAWSVLAFVAARCGDLVSPRLASAAPGLPHYVLLPEHRCRPQSGRLAADRSSTFQSTHVLTAAVVLLTATAVAALRPMKVHAPGQAVDSAG
jgi:hypothetical protein